ncbi:MAG TPA: hypothetical protein VMB75_04175 [Rhodocyclaceae bacterium]|nr:hypothetical protein [Rhodocyclaceae bacterium]
MVGAGIEINSRHEQTNTFLHDWQNHRLNRLAVRAFEWCDELTRTGNLFVVLATDQAGMTYLRAVPATSIDDIQTKPNDVEQPVQFFLKPTIDDPAPAPYPAYDPDTDGPDATGRFPTVMIHYAINRPVGAKWGESDLAPLLAWLSRHAAWLQDRARLNKYRQAFMYIVQGAYASAADRLARQAEINANPPNSGSILVTDHNELWGVLNPQLDSSQANEDGLALKKMIAAGAGVPLHFLAEPEQSNKSTAEQAGGPTFRHYQQRQVFFKWLLQDLSQIAVRRRSQVDRHISVKSDVEVQAPDISSRDNASLAVACTQIVTAFQVLHQAGLIPDDEFLRMAYTFAGETVDVEDILARAPRVPPAAVTANPGDAAGAGGVGAQGTAPGKNTYNISPVTGDVTIPAEKL